MIIDGKKIAGQILAELKKEIIEKNLKLNLAIILASDNAGLKKFVNLKAKAAQEIGIGCSVHEFPENISIKELVKRVKEIVADKANDGVIIELPLPKHVDAQTVLNEISLKKDVDVLSQEAQNIFFGGQFNVLPPAVQAVKTVLELCQINPQNKKVAIFGQGLLVGQPVAFWLEKIGAEVSRIDEFTVHPENYSRQADIVISGVGKPEFITGDMIKDGATIIDFGYENKGGTIKGDFDFNSVSPKAGLITPVPGGIGPVVVVSVLKNLIELNK
ncbi:MAG: bifunctional 5,10-methylenetetrahydrofolate dehydrogenase/5,10-methenyltetrahydrofolate cyclohydrolase [Patescibacteria group bacterium]